MNSLQSEFSDRLIALPGGRPGLRGTLKTEIAVPAPTDAPSDGRTDAPVLDFISSTETLDRYGEIISADGWRLDNYRRNPIFQNAHQYGDIIFTLGKALITEVRPALRSLGEGGPSDAPTHCLFQRIEFAVEANPMARIAYALYKGRFLNAVSVGFIPIRWENGTKESGFRRKYLEQELLEVSAVGIQANPDALLLGLRAGAIERSELREAAALLRSLAATGVGPVGPVRPVGQGQMLSLARELQAILRRI